MLEERMVLVSHTFCRFPSLKTLFQKNPHNNNSTPPLIQSQMSEVFKSLVYCDYPERWPGLLEAVYGHLASGDELRVYGGLVALRLLARKYEFRDDDERGPLVTLVGATFPALVAILRGVLANPAAGAAAGLTPAHYVKLALKVFWSATFMGIPDALLAEEQFAGWMGAVHETLRRPLPADQAPADAEDRAKWVWVKAQKWALHVAYRLFTRYTHASRCNPGNDQAFAKRFSVRALLGERGGRRESGRARPVCECTHRAVTNRYALHAQLDKLAVTGHELRQQRRRVRLGVGQRKGGDGAESLTASHMLHTLQKDTACLPLTPCPTPPQPPHAHPHAQAEVAPQFLEDILALLHPVATGGWLAPRCTNLALQFVSAAVEEKEPYRALKPHIDGLLLHVVLPLLAFNDADAELWADDPAEFVRKGYDILEDMYSPRTAAQNLLVIIAQKKRKAHLSQFMAHIASTLSAHDAAVREAAAAGRPVPADIARRMDGALLAVGTCADVLKHKSPYREQVEAMLLTFVAPCFESAHGHLRAKACWVAKEFSDFTFSGGEGESGRGPQFCGLFERVMRALADPELPVRVDAVVALRSFVDDLADLDILKPLLPSLLDSVFGLMAEVDNEDLIFTLEGIVEKFGDEIAPYAANLATNLAAAFWKYTQATEDDDGDDDTDTGGLVGRCQGREARGFVLQGSVYLFRLDHLLANMRLTPCFVPSPYLLPLSTAAMAAFGCIRTLNALLDSVSTLTHVLPALEEALFPIMYEMTSSRGQDVFEEVMDMASYFTYFMTPISPRMWTLWPRIQSCLGEWAIDYWDNILPPLDNLISRDTATFLGSTNPNYQESVHQVRCLLLARHSLPCVTSSRVLSPVVKSYELTRPPQPHPSPITTTSRWCRSRSTVTSTTSTSSRRPS